jgi:RNA polymerase sigma-70 factor (ECF subfamily)
MPNLFSRRSRLMGQEGSDFTSGPERPALSDWASALSWGVDETRLVTELQAGSETAFDWLVTHYHGPVYNLILSMLGDVADAADGTQEVFLKAFRGIRSFRQGSSLKTWLYRIAIREALNHKRWFKRHLQKNVSIDAEPEEGHAAIEIEDLAATPFEQFAAHEIQAAVQGALQQIPEVFRSAVILRDLEGLSYEEIAEVLECSAGTVKSRILRGRRALKELLEPLLVDRSAVAIAIDRSAVALAVDRSEVAHSVDRSVVLPADEHATFGNAPEVSGPEAARGAETSTVAGDTDRSGVAYNNDRGRAKSHSASSRMPRPAFAPHFGPNANTVSARSRFARESSASEELP